jgi:hypothetical protein
MSQHPTVWVLAGQFMQAKRQHGPDHPKTIAALAELTTARLLVHVEHLMADSPPLTGDQIRRVADVLAASGAVR